MQVVIDRELEEIFPTYLKNRQKDLVALESSLGAKDFEALRQIAHKTVGNASGYGLEHLSQYSRQLEQAAKDQKLDSCKEAFDLMKNYLAELKVSFK